MERQQEILNRLPRHGGCVRADFKDLERQLQWYKYTDQELDVIEKGLKEHEEIYAAKEEAKRKKREAIKARRKAERDKYLKGR